MSKLKKLKTVFVMLLVIAVLFVALFAEHLCPQDPYETSFIYANQAPSDDHWCGTDALGRDIFSRLILGTQTSVMSALLLVLVTTVLGTVVGLISGYFGGKIDSFLMGIVDTTLSFPDFVIALAILGIVGTGLIPAMCAVIGVKWAKYARLSRSLVMKIKTQTYITAAITNGTTKSKILFSHILPNIMPQIFVTASLDIGSMILMLSSLSFLGFGILPPTPEWGYMLNEGRSSFLTSPYLLWGPGSAIFIVVVIFNLFGDSMRDVFDTRSQ
ncbi:MAG: nickel transporter permease [Eubacteriales bacterium]